MTDRPHWDTPHEVVITPGRGMSLPVARFLARFGSRVTYSDDRTVLRCGDPGHAKHYAEAIQKHAPDHEVTWRCPDCPGGAS